MSESLFLTDEDLVLLTGRRTKSKQIEHLRREGIPFRINATGHPVVTRAAILGKQDAQEQPARAWAPRVIGA